MSDERREQLQGDAVDGRPAGAGTEAAGTEPARIQHEVSLRGLLLTNLRVLVVVSVLALLAYGLWRALAALFPEIPWLQSGS